MNCVCLDAQKTQLMTKVHTWNHTGSKLEPLFEKVRAYIELSLSLRPNIWHSSCCALYYDEMACDSLHCCSSSNFSKSARQLF